MNCYSILETFSSKKFKAIHRKEFNWTEIYTEIKNPLVYYRENYIDFRLECLKGTELECIDISFGIKLENKIIGLMPLFFIRKSNNNELSFLENSVYPIKFISTISPNLKKEIANQIIKGILILSELLKIKKLTFIDQLIPSKKLSLWHNILLQHNFKCHITRELFTDLKLDYLDLKKHYRKSYKSLISKGSRILNPYKFNGDDETVWQEFKLLHFKAAGRKTRSDRSWDLLFKEVMNNNSSFYYCTDQNGIMVGGSFIMENDFEAIYAVAAYNRELFNLPIGHFLQDFLIKDLLQTKKRWYRLGRKFHEMDLDRPTNKEIQIGKFKSGFSTDSIANFRFSLI
ncbi:MAG: hypothetical protein CBD95_001420 [Flavobacteriales bacterium TMED235]|nr:MAG: hypothetical protein CBD95_001420 [Flavobacteriales bacterium TMED235]